MAWESDKKYINIGFTVALAILVLLSFFTYRLYQENIQNDAWVKHTHLVLQTSKELLSNLKDAETGQRGYVITANEDYLEPFFRSLERSDMLLQDLRELTSDNPNQQQRIILARKLIDEKFEFSRKVIDSRNTAGMDSAVALINSGHGKRVMDQVRDVFSEIEAEEQQLLLSREETAGRSAALITTILVAGTLLTLALLVIAYFVLQRQLRLRAKKEEELLESHEWFAKTLFSLGDAVVATDNHFKITYMNPAAENLTGWSAADAKGKPVDIIYNAVHAVTREKVEVPVIAAISRRHIVSSDVLPILIRKDSSELYVDSRGAPIINSHDEVIGSVLIFRDVTEQKDLSDKMITLNTALEEQVLAKTNELIRNEHRLKLTLDNMLEGAQIVDFDWRYSYVNNMLLEQTGLPKEKLLGSTVLEQFPGLEKSELFRVLKLCMQERVPRQLEYKFTTPNNKATWFKFIIQPVPEGLFILSIDINERKKLEQERRTYIKTLEEMLYLTSHKVRQPVSQIMGISHMLDYPINSQEDLKKIVEYMMEAVHSLDNVTRDFTSFLYDQKQKREPKGE